MIPDYYAVLGLRRTASKDEIRKAFRDLALKFHPDRNKSPDAHQRFIEIDEAYLLLYDDEAREKYDLEYDFHFKRESPEFNYHEAKKPDFEYASHGSEEDKRGRFRDEDLNRWSKNAKEQASEFAKMSFEEFSKRVLGFVKETGFHLGNTFVIFIGILLAMSGCGNIVIGFSTSGEMGNPLIGFIFLPIGIALILFAQKNWDNHDA